MSQPVKIHSKYLRLTIYSYLDARKLLGTVCRMSRAEHDLILKQRAALLGSTRTFTVNVPRDSHEQLDDYDELHSADRLSHYSFPRAAYMADTFDFVLPPKFSEEYLVHFLAADSERLSEAAFNFKLWSSNEDYADVKKLKRVLKVAKAKHHLVPASVMLHVTDATKGDRFCKWLRDMNKTVLFNNLTIKIELCNLVEGQISACSQNPYHLRAPPLRATNVKLAYTKSEPPLNYEFIGDCSLQNQDIKLVQLK